MHQEIESVCLTEAIGLSSGVVEIQAGSRPHRHNEVELNFLERGALTYLFGKQQIVVSSGQFLVFWAIMPHYILEAVPETTLHWLTLPVGRFLQWHLPAAITQPVLQGQIIWDQKESRREYQLFSQWHYDLQEPWHDSERVMLLEVEARLRRIVQPLPSHPSLPIQQMTTHLPRSVEAMVGFITEHYMEPLQLGQIAQAVGLHPGYATDLFRKTFGITIMDYLAQHRVAHAQRLLATTDQTVLDVAMEVGFTSASRFYATFQKITGQSPRVYRSSLLP
jgi:AraC-like DNA-binding protein